MKRVVVILASVLVSLTAFAQTLDVPVLDVPYNVHHGLRGPSMQQSLALSASFYNAWHYALQNVFGERHPYLNKAAISIFDLMNEGYLALPLADAWLHEEWHRAVMGNRGINSFDDVYLFKINVSEISVSHVRDEDLIRLKRDHPADMVRLNEAGAEAQNALVLKLEKERFFSDSKVWNLPVYLLEKLNNLEYIASGTDRTSDEITDDSNAREGANVKKRDFTGHDFIAWMYDLSRPNEPYAARGIHPSGVGINRYRKTTDLTRDELAFLNRQGKLEWLNFLDPNLLGFDRFKIANVEWNANATHTLTSFGYAIDANVFVRTKGHKLFVTVHDYVNHDRSFPGLDVELLDRRVRARGHDLILTPRLALWSQPRDQRFRTSDRQLGGMASLRVDIPHRGRYGTYVALDAKSAGWVAGNERLDGNVSMRFGVTRTVF